MEAKIEEIYETLIPPERIDQEQQGRVLKQFFGFVVLLFVTCIGVVMVSDHLTTYIFRYRLTVDVDTPDGIKSGSSVVEATYFREMLMFSSGGGRHKRNARKVPMTVLAVI
ncbi:hypothetical protein N8E89_22335 (plasmid) [Phyllobacterium sp. A18/5-2]|uniref:hypothetical protein n=1 Tax=Phyllobacterium sp. A18/5-2 TaxID=2978392 RepID=UPI0021C8F4D7|nr:hypothetical protein [Phyllobacterium sp. A18/5-2]UXN67225.1 hypothetical protein N8E89_22335 [Phyllobacterium sp. A18/5-2]